MSLTLVESRERAALVHDVSYAVSIDLTDPDRFACRTTLSFGCRQPGASTFLELTDAEDLEVEGVERWDHADGRILLHDLRESNEVTVTARLPYVTDGAGMHTFTDPADDRTYVSAYCGMDLAQRVFACFDQNDLKARVTLRVRAPEGWTVLANARPLGTPDDGRWEFAPTRPIPVAMFVLCAGPWHSRTWEREGRDGGMLPFGWHARASMAEALDRDFDELRAITDACFDHYADLFTEPFAYDSYDQAMVPGNNWGAMECPGCVTYRDELLPLGPPTLTERRTRAMVVAHEMAHMWFGNLVTMTWWEDTWLQESFADYMGYRVAQAAAGVDEAFADFTIRGKVGAHLADERRSSHPVAALTEEVVDVEVAAGNFDEISYAKGNSCLHQLVTWLGEETFLRGVDTYLTRHRDGNTVLADFVAALDEASDRDVRGWVEAWLRTTGFDTVRVSRQADGTPVLTREGSRPHRLAVTAYDDTATPTATVLVDLGDQPLALPELAGAAAVVPNSGSETFARLRLDDESWEAVSRDLASVPDRAARAVLWATAFDLVRSGELPAADYLALLTRHLPRESHPVFVDALVRTALRQVVPRYLAPGTGTEALTQVAAACESGLASEPDHEVEVALLRGLAETTPDAALLERWLVDRATHTGTALEPTLRWTTLTRLARLGALDATGVREERESDGTSVGALGAARALAAIPTREAKDAAWATMTGPDVSNRVFEASAAGLWDVEQLDLVAPFVARYAAEAPGLARARGATFAGVVGSAFPAVPLTDPQRGLFEEALAADVPTVLRRDWEDALDDLAPRR